MKTKQNVGVGVGVGVGVDVGVGDGVSRLARFFENPVFFLVPKNPM